ncbi:MAG: MFS transporter [Gammaproteobacteria bacterium]|nr:MAG: MFS transporter [Gammaproteobacteria bacterium]
MIINNNKADKVEPMFKSLSQKTKASYFLILAMAFIYFSSGSMLLYLPKFFVHLGSTKQEAGFLVALSVIPFVLLSILSGHLANKFGSWRLVLLGNILHFSAALLFITVDEVSPLVYLLRIMQGIGHVCVFTPLFTSVARIVPDNFKAQGIGYFTIAIQFGTASGSFLGELAINNLGYTKFFLIVAFMNTLCALASGYLRGSEDETHAGTANSLGEPNGTKWLLVFGGMTLILVLGGVFGTLLQFIPVYFDEMLTSGVIAEAIPGRAFLTSGLITVACIRLLGGKYSDGKHKGVIVAVCNIGLLVVLYLITYIDSITTSLLVSIMFGGFYGLLYPMTNAYVLTKVGAKVRGAVTGSLTMLFEIGFRGYALVAGIVAHHLGFEWMFYSMVVFYAVGALFYYLTILVSSRRDFEDVVTDEDQTVFEEGMVVDKE